MKKQEGTSEAKGAPKRTKRVLCSDDIAQQAALLGVMNILSCKREIMNKVSPLFF